ncbi:MAG: Lamin globular tail-like protein [Parcubacteria group bacterium]|nr:Lamin globular tail-like protein [Parcubacteria group bacterium]
MYDLLGSDSGREWIEIYNSGSTPITIGGGSGSGSWRFGDNSGAHTLTLSAGSATLAAGEYAIIANDPSSNGFLSDWPSFSGNIFKSSFSLPNTSATLSIKDGSGIVTDQISYTSSQGAGGDGNSLQNSSSGWLSAAPTPGIVSASTSAVPVATSTPDQDATSTTPQTTTSAKSSSGEASAHYGSASLSAVEPISKFEIGAGRDRLGVIGSPVEFKAEMKYTYNGYMNFKWSFGDGAIGYGSQISHSYAYPGEYVVVLNASSLGGQAVSRASVKVMPVQFSITVATPERVEITNQSKSEVNLFGRALVTSGKTFVFPEDTILKAGQKISFSSSVTGIQPSDATKVSLLVVGDSLNKSFVPSQTADQNNPELNSVDLTPFVTKVDELKKEIAALPTEPHVVTGAVKKSPAVKSTKTTSLAATPVLSIASTSSLPVPEKVVPIKRSWLQTLRSFFLGSTK